MVRPFTLRDLTLVRRLGEQGVSLYTESALADNLHPLRGALLNLVVRRDYPTLIWKSRKRDEAGFIQLLLRDDRQHAHILYLSPSLLFSEPILDNASLSKVKNGEAWLSLLDEAVSESGRYGIQSLVAEVDEQGAELPILKRAGFAIYARQDVWKLTEEQPTLTTNVKGLTGRRGRQEDDWEIQLLYANTVPRLVRLVEPSLPASADDTWIWREANKELAAVVHIHEGKVGTWLRFYFHPQADAESEAILHSVLARRNAGEKRPIFCCVRRYEGWLPNILESNGFELARSQAVMVRHTVHHMREKENGLRVALEGSGMPVSSPTVGRYPVSDHEEKQL